MSSANTFIQAALESGALTFSDIARLVFFFQGHSRCVPGIISEPLTLDSKPGVKTLAALDKILDWEKTYIDPFAALKKRVAKLESKGS